MPTVCDLLGVEGPKNDGQSMLPIFTNQRSEAVKRTLYWEFGEQGGKQSVLQGDWKLVRFGLKDPVYELYNVVQDPSDEIDRLSEFPEKATELKKLLESIPDEKSPFRDV